MLYKISMVVAFSWKLFGVVLSLSNGYKSYSLELTAGRQLRYVYQHRVT